MPSKWITHKHISAFMVDRGGKFLSHDTFQNTSSKGTFECKYGHVWETTIGNVYYSRSWCPMCSAPKCEAMAMYIIERITGRPFVKTRCILPSRLELDGYNDELKLAIEYNGAQHYVKNVGFHHREDGSFEKQLERDKLKIKECNDLGIKLIVIHYKTKTFHSIKNAIMSALLSDVSYWDEITFDIDWASAQKECIKSHDMNSKTLEKIKTMAAKRGGKCLSTLFINNVTKLQFKCHIDDHEIFETTPSDFLRNQLDNKGRWCPECGGTKKKGIDYHIDIINKLGGVYKRSYNVCKGDVRNGKTITKARTFIVFTCKNDHEVDESMDNLKRAIRNTSVTSGCNQCRQFGVKSAPKKSRRNLS